MRHLLPIIALLALGVSACSTTGTKTSSRHSKFNQYQAESDGAHKVRAWRSADRFALGGD